jgi:hypothetical protein
MGKLTKLSSLIIFILMFVGSGIAEIVYLKDGSIIKGQIVSQNESNLILRTSYGELKINKEQIKSVSYSNEISANNLPIESEAGKDKTEKYRVSNISVKEITNFGLQDIFLFNLDFISIENSEKTTKINTFISDYEGDLSFLVNKIKLVKISSPQLVDDEGNIFKNTEMIGEWKEYSDVKYKNLHEFELPYKGKVPVSFVFPRIPNTSKKIFFTINNKTEDINWQKVINNEPNKK